MTYIINKGQIENKTVVDDHEDLDTSYQIKFIGHNLSIKEMECKCHLPTCHFTLINYKLILAWERLRKSYGKPLTVTSGFRCQEHNQNVQGVVNSKHTTGSAIDISFLNKSSHEIACIIRLADSFFEYIKIYETFIHCDVRDG